MCTFDGRGGADVFICNGGRWCVLNRPAGTADDENAQEDDTEYDSNSAQAEEHTAYCMRSGLIPEGSCPLRVQLMSEGRDFAWRVSKTTSSLHPHLNASRPLRRHYCLDEADVQRQEFIDPAYSQGSCNKKSVRVLRYILFKRQHSSSERSERAGARELELDRRPPQ